MAGKDLTAERLRELLNYDPETGIFTWRVQRGCRRPGETTGFVKPDSGHMIIAVDGARHFAHRLAWLYVHGMWPQHKIDHLDGNPQNNRLSNLRDVPHAVNLQNLRKAKSNSKTGILGVSYYPRCKRWKATIGMNGKYHYLGLYKSPEEASAAYLEAKRKLHSGCTI